MEICYDNTVARLENHMEKYILPGLIANAATLGIHWIYDHKYLEQLSNEGSLLFLRQEKSRYDQANPAYYSYPNSNVGDLTVQGQIMRWLYRAMKDNTEFSKEDYSKLLYNQFKPGGSYTGFVESYSKKHVFTYLAKSLDIPITELPVMDDHLVGFVPYIVCKELGLKSEKAFELATVYTEDKDYLIYFKMFDELLELLPKYGMHESIKRIINLGPDKYQTALSRAIEMDDVNEFIEKYSGRACAIKFSIPLIIHILSHTSSYQEAIEYNALLGGAISDRNTLLGAFYAQVSAVPKIWSEMVVSKIIL
jgi:hypothetical protein